MPPTTDPGDLEAGTLPEDRSRSGGVSTKGKAKGWPAFAGGRNSPGPRRDRTIALQESRRARAEFNLP
jgi:hypothetical protein